MPDTGIRLKEIVLENLNTKVASITITADVDCSLFDDDRSRDKVVRGIATKLITWADS